jgi:hypothetical protein
MTYDENDDYNGPDTHRRGPFLFMAAIVGVILVAGGVAAVSDARADPNTETVLPADGVLSITRSGDVWSVTTDGIPSEVKLLSPRNEVLCGVNYGIPCMTVTAFTSTGDCAFLQVDGIPGFNSSDPFLCIGGTPSTTPVATEPATTSPTPTATTEPSPSPTPTNSPTSTPAPPLSPPASTDSPAFTPAKSTEASPTSAPARLADTGMDATPALAVFAVFAITIGATTVWGRRKGLERFGSES